MLVGQVRLDLITLSTPSARSRPWDKGGTRSSRSLDKGDPVAPNIFSVFRALVWSKNTGGGGGSPLDPPLNTNIEEEEGQQSTSISAITVKFQK